MSEVKKVELKTGMKCDCEYGCENEAELHYCKDCDDMYGEQMSKLHAELSKLLAETRWLRTQNAINTKDDFER